MSDNDTGGNAADSPTADTTDQGTSTTDQGQSAGGPETTDQSGQTAADSQAAGDSTGQAGEEGSESNLPDKETLPFDQHPKWQSARAAEARVQGILEKYGYDSIDDLEAAAVERNSLRELIGNRDAEQLVQDSEELANIKNYWAEQEAAKREANESPEETIARQRDEIKRLNAERQRESEDRAAIAESQRALNEFDATIHSSVSSLEGRTDAEKAMLTRFLGVGSEVASVDPTDKSASKKAITFDIQQFGELIDAVKQETIEAYVKGKSNITPITKSDTPVSTESVKAEGKKLPKDATMDQVNKAAKEELLERFTATLQAE